MIVGNGEGVRLSCILNVSMDGVSRKWVSMAVYKMIVMVNWFSMVQVFVAGRGE